MIDTCLFAVLYIHGNSYTSQKLYSNKNTELYWNNSVSSLWCVSHKYVTVALKQLSKLHMIYKKKLRYYRLRPVFVMGWQLCTQAKYPCF